MLFVCVIIQGGGIMGHKFDAILSFGALAKEETLLKEC